MRQFCAHHFPRRSELTRQSSQSLGNVALDGHLAGLAGLRWQTLERNVLPGRLCLLLLLGVGLDTVQELFPALRVLDVLDPDVDALLEVSAVDDLVADDTDGPGGHVVDDTGLAVVDWVSVKGPNGKD